MSEPVIESPIFHYPKSLQVTFDHSNISGPLAVIPSVTVPLNLTGCSSVVPTTNWGKRGRRKPADTNSGDDVWNKT